VVARVVSVGDQAFGAVGRVPVFVGGPHRGQEVADAGAEDYGQERVDHGQVGGYVCDKGFADGPAAGELGAVDGILWIVSLVCGGSWWTGWEGVVLQ
jgi:hypothetical protein